MILRADVHMDNLANLFYEPIIKAKAGTHGMGKKMHGKGAVDKVVNVPIGTVVYRIEAPVPRPEDDEEETLSSVSPSGNQAAEESAPGFEWERSALQTAGTRGESATAVVSESGAARSLAKEMVVDLERDGQEFILCAGGRGGKGNVHFKSARNRAPVQYTEGEEGEQGHFLLELRTIADAALVGYPNAGKSTLLGRISAAHPKAAAYPFTTLRPSVGVVELDNYRRVTVADIPGLVEGAHRNVGLGHDFLRHITRCRYLLFVLDTAGSEGRNPIEDLQSLRREIDLYDPRLSKRPWCILANKIDLPGSAEHLETLRSRFLAIQVLPISTETGEGLAALKEHLALFFGRDQMAEESSVVRASEETAVGSKS